MSRFALFAAATVSLFVAPWAAQAAAAERKPNIVVIVADDLGYADLGIHGGKDVPTPQIDALANSGVRLTNGYVSGTYCSPTRAGLLTGRYQQRFGYEFNPGAASPETPEIGLPVTETTLADRLARRAIVRVWLVSGTWGTSTSCIRKAAASKSSLASSAARIPMHLAAAMKVSTRCAVVALRSTRWNT